MVNYKNKEEFTRDQKVGDIIFSNHTLEFSLFFKNHKQLCDEISGLKPHTLKIGNENKPIYIDKTNFKYGIKMLNAFLINYLHYIDEKSKEESLMKEFYNLEEEFTNDTLYFNYVNKNNDLSKTQEMEFNKKYLYYLIKTFEISNIMSNYLQKSLNIASREIMKNIQYVDYNSFFNNLSEYRNEIANDLSNISYKNIYEHFKKMMGFYYTYRYLITKEYQGYINNILKSIHDYIVSDDTIKHICKLKESSDLSNYFIKDREEDLKILRNALNKIYKLINLSFSNKNILPKIMIELNTDMTLI